jgi:TolB protein
MAHGHRPSRSGVLASVAAAVTVATTVLPASPVADAAFPGGAGRIVMSVLEPGSSTRIWTISSVGARPRLVLRAKTDVVAPSWSADGRRLAVVIGGAVWRVNGDGQRLARVSRAGVVDAESPSWSPDGKRIAFAARTKGRNLDVYVCRVDGGGLTRLTRSLLADEHPSWSPDGKRIAFARARSSIESEVWVMNTNGSSPHRVANGGTPDWSPDGKRIAVTLGGSIAVVKPDGSGLERIVDGPGMAGGPAWSPDGRWLVFWSDRASGEATKGDLYLVPSNGGEVKRVTDEPEVWHFDPSWQPLPRNGTR